MSKPTVHYIGDALIFGTRALLYPVDHPNHVEGHKISNTHPVTTSTVVSHDKATGRIETRNTIYMPKP